MEEVRLVFNYRPFVINQTINIFNKNNVLIDMIKTTMTSADKTILKLKSRYNIIKIDLCGNKKMLSKLQEVLKNNFDNVPVEIIEH